MEHVADMGNYLDGRYLDRPGLGLVWVGLRSATIALAKGDDMRGNRVVRRSRQPGGGGPPPTLADAGRARGFNVDYLLAERFGWAVPEFARRLLGGTPEGESDCREVARRVVLPRDRHRAALDFASTFWLVLVFASLGLFFAEVCAVGAVNHRLLASPVALGLAAALIGSMALSMIAALFAGTRKRWLDDPLVRRHSRRDVPGLATPKPYDSLVAIAAGVLGAAVYWAAVQDGIAAAQP